MSYTTIDDPSAYFQTKIYSGSSSAQALTFDGNSDMQPDWLWLKRRSAGGNHFVYDSVRGANRSLVPNDTDAEDTSGESTSYLTSFDSDGFTVAGGYNNTNNSGSTYVGWGWKKQSGVFDIVTYTGNGSNRTISHNLNSIPTMMIIKNYESGGTNWFVYHVGIGDASKYVKLNQSNTESTKASLFNSTAPTSSVFSLGTDNDGNENNQDFICYLFGNKQGVSHCGSFVGNNSSDGTFVPLSFKPRWIMIKGINIARNWGINDTKRSPINQTQDSLYANVSDAETGSGNYIDFTASGFKLRDSALTMNGAYNYIYMAFAENPFVTSTGVPACAR